MPNQHQHVCARCEEPVDCTVDGCVLSTEARVSPKRGQSGPEHCPPNPGWTWVRAYVHRRISAEIERRAQEAERP